MMTMKYTQTQKDSIRLLKEDTKMKEQKLINTIQNLADTVEELMKEQELINTIQNLADTVEEMKKEIQQNSDDTISDLVDKYVIVRCHDAGVHFGRYVSHKGRQVTLADSRRMWRWWAKTQMTLSAVAEFGLNEERKELRIQCTMSDNITLLEACEILTCTQACVESFARVKPYNEQKTE
jgi:hypothetical protein